MDNYLRPYGDIELHRRMIADRVRTDAFAAAIQEVVQPGDVVLDVGTGTGVLAMLAAKAGARKVYGIDMTDIAVVATELVKANKLEHLVEFLRGAAGELELDAPVDLIVSEWLGHAVFAEGMVHAILDARDNNLAANGKMMPSQVRVFLAPIDDAQLYHQQGPGYWRQSIHDLDFGSLEDAELVQGGVVQMTVDAESLLAEGQVVLELDMASAVVEDIHSELTLEFLPSRDGELNGFCVWFEADLSPSVTLDTGPAQPNTHWAQSYLAFRPRTVRAGESFEVGTTLFYDPDPVAISRSVGLCLKLDGHELRFLID